jgi:hypothetical protein
MIQRLTIDSRSGLRRAIVSVDDTNGVIVNHYRRLTHDGKWTFDRICRPTAPYHVVLDQAHATLNAPPKPGGGQL